MINGFCAKVIIELNSVNGTKSRYRKELFIIVELKVCRKNHQTLWLDLNLTLFF